MRNINETKNWLRSHAATLKEIPVYVSNLRELFHQKIMKFIIELENVGVSHLLSIILSTWLYLWLYLNVCYFKSIAYIGG